MKTQTIPLATLVEDFTLYPRHRVDDAHVSELVRTLQAGHVLPAIIADAKTLRIVDGFHRRRAYLKHLGDDARVQVELRKYADEAELFTDAVALNSQHGRRLDRQDQTRIVLKMRELQIPDQRIAITLHVPEPIVQQLSIRILQTTTGPTPLKRGLEHLRGTVVSAEQVAAMDSVRSAEAGRLCLELMRLLEAQLVDLTDERTMTRLHELQDVLDRILKTAAA